MNVLAEELRTYYEEIQPYEFYREIFGDGELDELDAKTPGKYTAIALEITKEKKKLKNGKEKIVAYRHTVTDDLDMVDQLLHSPHFCVMAPLSYAGKSRHSKNARMMYALGVELDNLWVKKHPDGRIQQIGLENLIDRYSDRAHYVPKPTFVVASGNGVHLYYQFEKPLVLFPNTIDSLKRYKEQLTKMIWSRSVTSSHTDDKIQQESIFQAFRMPGTMTKNGDRAVAFRVGEKVSIEYMNSFMRTSFKGKNDIEGTYKSALLLKDAKEKYPEWYEKVVVNKDHSLKEWAVNRAVYDWWLREIKDGAVDGHRYYCLKMLAIYAIKCGNYDPKKNPNPVTQEEFEADAWSLLDDFNERGKRADNPFTEYDVLCALQVYEDRGMITYPANSISYKSGITIEPSVPRREKGKRLKQAVHLRLARANRDILCEERGKMDWREGAGRPIGSGTAFETVRAYREAHPEAKKADCIRDTGLSKPTVYKWWDGEPAHEPTTKKAKKPAPEWSMDQHAEAVIEPPSPNLNAVIRELISNMSDVPDEDRKKLLEAIANTEKPL